MTMLLSSFGRAVADYRVGNTILLAYAAAMASLIWYLDVDPHYQTAALYVNWSFSAVSSMASLYMLWTLKMLARREEHPTAALKAHCMALSGFLTNS